MGDRGNGPGPHDTLGLRAAPRRLPAPLPLWRTAVTPDEWERAARNAHGAHGRLVSLWGSDRAAEQGGPAVSAAYALDSGLAWLQLSLDAETPRYMALSPLFPSAGRMERATFDLLGFTAEGAGDRRPWLRHAAWPEDYFPLRIGSAPPAQDTTESDERYPFVVVAGDGVHEIPVGPVHAGIIEPGHFRFSVVGEKVLRLEERLGYTHKGIEKRFESMPLHEGYRLAGRVSGDATVAYAWAYCMAVESLAACEIPPRADWLRALMLERERVANHLGDLGALGNDAAFAFGLAQFSRLREDWLRLNHAAFGHRLLMDRIVPGGVAADLAGAEAARIARQCEQIEREVRTLRSIYDEHAGLQDRFMTTGCVTPELAARLGLCGLAGRASGIARDLRADYVPRPYRELGVRAMSQQGGDVAARVAVRFDELFESLRLIRIIAAQLPAGPAAMEPGPAAPNGAGAGWVESWRGEVLVTIELDAAGAIRRCHCHDPSWQNWPLLEHAVIGNIVPDFPLINKSFNLSYSGHDL
jgi:Ni,Fe-hydrogenase III large subunit/Ni,Fe-hydrogenase III component G